MPTRRGLTSGTALQKRTALRSAPSHLLFAACTDVKGRVCNFSIVLPPPSPLLLHQAAYRVVCWPAGAAWRHAHKLPWHDFHITLGFKEADVHTKSKGLPTVARIHPAPAAEINAVVAAIDGLLRKDPAAPYLPQLVDMAVASATANLEAAGSHGADGAASAVATASVAAALKLRCKLARTQGLHAEVIEAASTIVDLYGKGPEATAAVDSGVLAWRGFAEFKLQMYAEALASLSAVLASITRSTDDTSHVQKRIKISQTLVECRRQLGVATQGDFHKFPRTHHIWDAGGSAGQKPAAHSLRGCFAAISLAHWLVI